VLVCGVAVTAPPDPAGYIRDLTDDEMREHRPGWRNAPELRDGTHRFVWVDAFTAGKAGTEGLEWRPIPDGTAPHCRQPGCGRLAVAQLARAGHYRKPPHRRVQWWSYCDLPEHLYGRIWVPYAGWPAQLWEIRLLSAPAATPKIGVTVTADPKGPPAMPRIRNTYAAARARRDRIDGQLDRIAALIGVDPETVMHDSDGPCLTADQADALLALIPAAAEDTASSVSVTHHIDTGRYLTHAEVAALPVVSAPIGSWATDLAHDFAAAAAAALAIPGGRSEVNGYSHGLADALLAVAGLTDKAASSKPPTGAQLAAMQDVVQRLTAGLRAFTQEG
jgi:hypothetical protein